MNTATAERILQHPKFQRLVRRRSRLTWSLLAVILGAYLCLICTIAFRPAWMRVPVADGATLTIGWPLAAGMIILVWLLMGLYVWRANTEFEELAADIRTEVRQ
jgi:uncharacterized membrane protein (DUF485 family)